ncbi:hypothetical protein GCM10009839_36450 [Catenulispora yoronensis]|uniref:Uncharacterized protein n=1 Tax=Catenulispora yoronensis TaxID=450799 RepID=A0ABP5FV23_9ACTN
MRILMTVTALAVAMGPAVAAASTGTVTGPGTTAAPGAASTGGPVARSSATQGSAAQDSAAQGSAAQGSATQGSTTITKPTPTIQPDPAAPGGRIWVSASAAGCPTATGTATSPALTAPITMTATRPDGQGTLRDDLISGAYTLTLHCGGTVTATIHVVAAAQAAGSVAPRGAADTGDGSASDHLGIGDAALGTAFVLSGIGFATASVVRRRRAGTRE